MSIDTPLSLIPGLLCDASLWRHQIEKLSPDREISVADTTRDDTMAAMARTILQGAPPRFALAGLSMGGYVCLEIMRQAPERVERLALLNTAAVADDSARRRQREALIRMSEIGRFKGVTPRLLPQLIHPDRLEDKALVDVVLAMAERLGRDVFLRQQKAIMSRADSRPFLAEIRVPTLVLCGRQDALTPLARHAEMAACIPGARLCIIEQCGHLSALERPHAVTALMRDWLTRPR